MVGGMPQGSTAVGAFLLLLASALVGSSVLDLYQISTAHETCLDGIDQPEPDPGLDFGPPGFDPSLNCLTYPWSDGSGEKETPLADQGNNPGGYASSIWDFVFEEYVTKNGGDPCMLASFYSVGFHPDSLVEQDGSVDQANQFLATVCSPPPPPPP